MTPEQKDAIKEKLKEFTNLSPTPTYDLYLRYCMFHGVQPVSWEEYLEIVSSQ